MPDLLNRIRTEMSARLEELRPLVDEQRRLEAALIALRDTTSNRSAPSAGPPARASPRTGSARRARRGTPVPRGANRDAVLRAVRDRPGATSAELATAAGVKRNTLYGVLGRLVKEGKLQTQSLPTGRTGYAVCEPPERVVEPPQR